MAIPTPKQRVATMLKRLPASATYEDIQYRVYVLESIQRGLDDIAAGRVYTQEEVERRMAKWLTKSSGRRKRRAS